MFISKLLLSPNAHSLSCHCHCGYKYTTILLIVKQKRPIVVPQLFLCGVFIMAINYGVVLRVLLIPHLSFSL